MYGLSHLKSAKHLAARLTAAAAAPNPLHLLRSSRRSHEAAAGIGNFATVAKISDIHSNYEGKMLPPELSRNLVKLQCDSSADGGVCDVYLLGAGAYAESWQQGQDAIQLLKPEVVFLEMWSSHEHRLIGQKVKMPTLLEMLDMLKKKQNPFWRLVKWYLCRSGPQLVANDDFRLAYEEAIRYGGKVILGNRPRVITFSRYLAKIPLSELIPRFPGISFQLGENIKKDDMRVVRMVVQLMNYMYPTFTKTFIHECDQYMSAKLLEVAREHTTVVAVVDPLHLQGIQNHWKEPVDMKQLHGIPMARNASIIMFLIFVILVWWFEKNYYLIGGFKVEDSCK